MRIALVSDWTAPRLGGVERQVQDLALQLRLHGHEVRVITFTPGPAAVEGIPVHRLAQRIPPGWRALQRGLERVGYELGDPMPRATTRDIAAILGDQRIDVVHGHSFWSSLAHMAIKLGRDRGIPGLLTNHSLLDRAGLVFFRAIDEVFPWSSWPSVITGVSFRAARDARLATGGRAVRVIPNGLDTTAWAHGHAAPHETPGTSTPRDGGLAAPRRRIVSVMRLNARKSPASLLRAIAQVRASLDRAAPRLDVFGDGAMRPALERESARLGIDDLVTFHGARGPNDIARALADADVFALPGRREAFGIAIVEALASGVPVVAMSGSGVDDVVVDGVAGFLAADEDELAERLALLVTDDALRMRMAARAPTQAERFDWDVVTPMYLQAYRDASSV